MRLNSSFKYRKIADKHLLIAVKKNSITNSMIEINDISLMIINLANKNCSKDDIVSNIVKLYNLDSSYIEALKDTLSHFLEIGILEE